MNIKKMLEAQKELDVTLFQKRRNKMKINFKKTNKVYGYYYYCANCNRQLDYYEYLRNDGLCDNCRYSK